MTNLVLEHPLHACAVLAHDCHHERGSRLSHARSRCSREQTREATRQHNLTVRMSSADKPNAGLDSSMTCDTMYENYRHFSA
jgi:hypothetical protein